MQGIQFPRLSHIPEWHSNYWQDVRDLCDSYGLHLMEWQENVLAASMGEREDGTWAASQLMLSAARQSGKTALLEARELAALLLFDDERLIVHSAHLVQTALEAFQRIKAYFENYDDLRRKVHQIRMANGEQGIELRNGKRLRFVARSKQAIRGWTPEVLIVDEAQILNAQTWSAMLPSISARANPQTWMVGTPPGPFDDGEVFARIRESGIRGDAERLCFMEWSAEPDSDLDAPESWAQANPSLDTGLPFGVRTEAILDERAAMDDEAFARERLGMWTSAGVNGVLPGPSWMSQADEHSLLVDRFALGVECGPDLGWASVALAGQRGDGDWHIELDDDQHTRGRGVAWLVPQLEHRVASNPELRAVVVDVAGPIAALLEKRRNNRWYFRGSKLEATPVKVSDLGAGCSRVLDGVVTGWLWHIGQPQLSAAALAAGKRALADTGQWVWSRKSAESDITPVQAATLALIGAQNSTVKKPGSQGNGKAVVMG